MGANGVSVEERFPLPAPTRETFVHGVSLKVGLGLLQHVNTALAQLSENPCVTVQVKITSSPGHAAALPSCSTLDTSTTSAVTKVSTGMWE